MSRRDAPLSAPTESALPPATELALPGAGPQPRSRSSKADAIGKQAVLHLWMHLLMALMAIGSWFVARQLRDWFGTDRPGEGWTWLSVAFALIAAPFTCTAIILCERAIRQRRARFARAIPARAVVTRARRKPRAGVSAADAAPRIHYTDAAGVTHDAEPFLQLLSPWVVGQTVDVRYDPDDPTWVLAPQSLDRSIRLTRWSMAGFAALSIAAPLLTALANELLR